MSESGGHPSPPAQNDSITADLTDGSILTKTSSRSFYTLLGLPWIRTPCLKYIIQLYAMQCLLPARVSLSISPPSDISAVLRVMLLRWARVVVSWMKRSLVRTPIMVTSLVTIELPSSQMLTFLFHFTVVQSFRKSNNHDFAHITSGGFSLPVSFI